MNHLITAASLLQSHVKGSKVLLITNDRIAPMYLEKYESLLKRGGQKQVDTLVLPDGEENKSMDVLSKILDKALECALDRKATFVALGGGVIGDMVGFAAAIYQRGVNFIQVSDDEKSTPARFFNSSNILFRSRPLSWLW